MVVTRWWDSFCWYISTCMCLHRVSFLLTIWVGN